MTEQDKAGICTNQVQSWKEQVEQKEHLKTRSLNISCKTLGSADNHVLEKNQGLGY